ncbi:MAG: SAM-dependent methyltransferase [Mycobacterium sp.]
MRESSNVVRPQPMESSTYSASSRLQAAGLKSATELFEQAAAQVPIPAPPQPIAIADYGAANGYNSLLPMGAAVAVLRARTRPDHAILVAHTDLPDNDFTALFTTLTEDPDSYLTKDSATFPSAVGRSFYRQILPSESIALGWSSWATHWLSRVPAPIPDHIHIAHSAEPNARRAFTQQAALDWQDFLAFRGRELAPGGRLVVLTLGVDDTGLPGFAGVMQALLAALHGLVDAGTLHPEEVARMAIPTVGRTEEEFRAPFAPSGRFEGLSVERLETFTAEDQFWARYRHDGDAAALGASWAGFARAAVFPTLATALEGGPHSPRAVDFVDTLESAVAAHLASSPQQMAIPLAALVLIKRHRSR